jgi:hypothetical protein
LILSFLDGRGKADRDRVDTIRSPETKLIFNCDGKDTVTHQGRTSYSRRRCRGKTVALNGKAIRLFLFHCRKRPFVLLVVGK